MRGFESCYTRTHVYVMYFNVEIFPSKVEGDQVGFQQLSISSTTAQGHFHALIQKIEREHVIIGQAQGVQVQLEATQY